MRAVFADTFYWIALLNPRDESHNQVVRVAQQKLETITTHAVLDEMLNHFANQGSFMRQRAYEFSLAITQSSEANLIPHCYHYRQAGLDLYGQRLDKGYSLTDCVSMVVMRAHGIREALTHDHHFTQEGFVILFP